MEILCDVLFYHHLKKIFLITVLNLSTQKQLRCSCVLEHEL